jgi:Zn-dependent peptidase ImmA (M78 family)
MKRSDPYLFAALQAEQVIRDRGIVALPVEPIAIAQELDIEVVAKPANNQGISGMLMRVGNSYGIAYATHLDNPGFERFSIAHELAHYFLPGHVDAVFDDHGIHESHAGFGSDNRYELEADHFAAALLMPRQMFSAALRRAGEGVPAIERLAGICKTSLTATAIRYTQCTSDPVAIVISMGGTIDYCCMSEALRDCDGLYWIRKRQAVPRNTATFAFNRDPDKVRHAHRIEDESDLQTWFGGSHNIKLCEHIIGLGRFGKTLTVLHGIDLPDDQDEDDDQELTESWTPRFRR